MHAARVTVVGAIVDAMNTIQTTEAASEEGLYDRSKFPVGLQRSYSLRAAPVLRPQIHRALA